MSKRQQLDKKIIKELVKHADEMLLDLWQFSHQKPHQMQQNISQLARFTNTDLQREINTMSPQMNRYFQQRNINLFEFLLVYFGLLSKNSYAKTGRFVTLNNYLSNYRIIKTLYYDTLSQLNVSPSESAASNTSVRTWKSVIEKQPSQYSQRGNSTMSSHVSHKKVPTYNRTNRASTLVTTANSEMTPQYGEQHDYSTKKDEAPSQVLTQTRTVREPTYMNGREMPKPASFAANKSAIDRLKKDMLTLQAGKGIATYDPPRPDDSVTNFMRPARPKDKPRQHISRKASQPTHINPSELTAFSTHTVEKSQNRFINIPDLDQDNETTTNSQASNLTDTDSNSGSYTYHVTS